MSTTLLKNCNIQNPFENSFIGDILIEKDVISKLDSDIATLENCKVIDVKGQIITPGLIDQHIHGGFGVDFNSASYDDINKFALQIVKHGITSVIATVMTDSSENICRQNEIIAEYTEKNSMSFPLIKGLHLEGPLINPDYKGIHASQLMQFPTVENLKKISNKHTKIVTYAPELDKDLAMTKFMAQNNIIPSAGHCKASNNEIKSAQGKGLKQITHLFNAMPSLHHRNIGVIGEALTNDNIYVEVIADHQHLAAEILTIIQRTKPKTRIIFISDSLPLNRSQNDSIIFGGQKVLRVNGKAQGEDGTFAGSLSFLDDNLRKNLNLFELKDIIGFCTLNPAQNLGFSDLGFIKPNNKADLVIWNSDFTVNKTFLAGKCVYNSDINQ